MANELFGFTLTPQITTANPATVSDPVAAGPRFTLGGKYIWKGNLYRYVKYNSGSVVTASVAGGPAYWKTLTPAAATPVWTVTSYAVDSLFGAWGVAGILLAASITTLNFIFIQIGGLATIFAGETAGAFAAHYGSSIQSNQGIAVAYGATGPLATLAYGLQPYAVQQGATAGDGTQTATALLQAPLNQW